MDTKSASNVHPPRRSGSTAQTPASGHPRRSQPVKRPASVAELLRQQVPEGTMGGGVSIREWLLYDAWEWTDQHIMAVNPEAENEDSALQFAAVVSFRAGVELACHVLERGKLDKTYGKRWRQLLAAAKQDVERWRAEEAEPDCA